MLLYFNCVIAEPVVWLSVLCVCVCTSQCSTWVGLYSMIESFSVALETLLLRGKTDAVQSSGLNKSSVWLYIYATGGARNIYFDEGKGVLHFRNLARFKF